MYLLNGLNSNNKLRVFLPLRDFKALTVFMNSLLIVVLWLCCYCMLTVCLSDNESFLFSGLNETTWFHKDYIYTVYKIIQYIKNIPLISYLDVVSFSATFISQVGFILTFYCVNVMSNLLLHLNFNFYIKYADCNGLELIIY